MDRVLPPLVVGLASRLLLFVTVTLGLVYGEPVAEDGTWRAFPENPAIDGWVRWDAAWYGGIAREGYIDPSQIVAGEARNTVFFPLYPLSMRALEPVTGDVFLSGLLVSNVCFLAALVCLYLLVHEKLDRQTALRTTILLAFNPYALFFSAVYTESMFLALVAASFYRAEHQRWISSSLLASLAGLTRVNGFLTAIAVFILYRRRNRDRPPARQIAVLLLGLVGPLAYLGFLWFRYGTPFEFVEAQLAESWATTEHIWPTSATEAKNWLFLLLSFLLSLAAWPRLGAAYGLWGGGTSLTSLTHWASGGRYALVVFPATVVLARVLRNRYLFATVLAYFFYYCLTYALRFSHWRWVA